MVYTLDCQAGAQLKVSGSNPTLGQKGSQESGHTSKDTGTPQAGQR
jgi:hypothetical protein